MVAQIVELVDSQTLFGQEVLNVFHFLDATGTELHADLAAAYIANVLPFVESLQSPSIQHVGLKIRSVYNAALLGTDYPIVPPLAGSFSTGDDEPSSTALSFKWALGSTTVLAGGFAGHIKRGGARVGGIREGAIIGNDCTSGIITSAAYWVAALISIDSAAWQLVVASFLNGARARQHTVQAYAPVLGGSSPSPSTQNTRKMLRGRSF